MSRFLMSLGGALALMFLMLVIGLSSHATAPVGAYEDPVLAAIKVCADNQARRQRATSEDRKAELLWWCTRTHYGLHH